MPSTVLREYCCKLYSIMDGAATDHKDYGRVYVGFTTNIFKSEANGLPMGMYDRILRELKERKCIEQIERGYSGRPSIWLLLRNPSTLTGWPEIQSPGRRPGLTKAMVGARLAVRVRKVEESLGGITSVLDALQNLESRIERLERSLGTELVTTN